MADPLSGAPPADLDALDQGADVPVTPFQAYGQAFQGSAFDLSRRALQFTGDHSVWAGVPGVAPPSPSQTYGLAAAGQLSADEANERFGIEGQLRFNQPVTESDAAFRQHEAMKDGYSAILNARSGANPLLTFGAGMAGSLVDPVGLGLMVATDGVFDLAKAGWAAKTAVDGAQVAARTPFVVNLGRELATGAALNAPYVGYDAYLRHDLGDDMSMGEALQDVAVGALFHTGVHFAGRLLAGRGQTAGPDIGNPAAPDTLAQPPFTPDEVGDLPAAERNGAWLKAADDLAGDEPVDVARHVEAARDPTSLADLDETDAGPQVPGRWGDDATAVTPRGTEVPVRYGLVELSDLTTSHDGDFNVNPAFPAELQPRDRARLGAMARNLELERELNPKLLMSDVSAAAGAPVVAPDGTVESGNGRVIALRRSAEDGRTDAYSRYRAALQAAGHDTEGMQAPVLVRMRTEPMTGAQRAALAREMNADVTERMSATEQALADARRISDDDLAQPMESPADVRAFHRAFLARVAPDQINQLVGADGRLSPEGERRVKAALVARAYGDPRTVAGLADPANTTGAEFADGLAAAAPDWARMRAMAARGEIPPDVDLTQNLNAAVDLVRQARAAGMALDRFLAERLGQTDIFSGEAIAPETEAFLRILFGDAAFRKPREAGRVAWALKEYARQAMALTPGPDLFGDQADGQTARQILAQVSQRFADGDAGRIDLRAPGKAAEPAGGAQPASEPPLVDLRRDGGERPGSGDGGLRQDGGGQAGRGGDEPGADVRQPAAPDPVAADPELKALADDTERLAAENGVEADPVPDNQKPEAVAAAVRAAGQCILDAGGEVFE